MPDRVEGEAAEEQVRALSEEFRRFIADGREVTFAELIHRFGSDKSLNGNNAIKNGVFPNVFLWADMSDLFYAAIEKLLNDNVIVMRPCNPWLYIADGGCLNFPILKHKPKRNPRGKRWFPVCLRMMRSDDALNQYTGT